jgi:hypothetical protein
VVIYLLKKEQLRGQSISYQYVFPFEKQFKWFTNFTEVSFSIIDEHRQDSIFAVIFYLLAFIVGYKIYHFYLLVHILYQVILVSSPHFNLNDNIKIFCLKLYKEEKFCSDKQNVLLSVAIGNGCTNG